MRIVQLLMVALSAGSLAAGAQDTTSTGLPRAFGAPEWTAAERAQREAALNAVLAFRTDLRGDSTRIAACALDAQVQDTAAVRWVLPDVRRLLIRPLVTQPVRQLGCSVDAFSKPGTRVLFLARLTEVRRRGFASGSGATAGLSFEADFQWLDGGQYRRFEHYEVRPRSADGRVWRVVRYELQGEEFLDDFGAAGRRP